MDNIAPVTPPSKLNNLSKDISVTGNVEIRDGLIGRAQNIASDVVHGNRGTGNQITAEFGSGVQNIVIGSGLDPFNEHHANLLFGREKLVIHLIIRVQETRFP